jgi:ribosome-associated protein
MPGPLIVCDSLVIAERELSWRFSRSSGPGGQSVNTTDSRVELSFDVQQSEALSYAQRAQIVSRLGNRLVDGVLTVSSAEHRSQLRNREAAESRLAALLENALAPPPKPRKPTKPSRRARKRRVENKKQRSETKRLRQPPDR